MLMKDKIIFAILAIIIIVGIFYSGYKMNEISQKTNEEYSVPEADPRSYVMVDMSSDNEQIVLVKRLLAFDKNNKLVDSRIIWEFSTEEIAKQNYENWKEAGNLNLSIKENVVYFNEDITLKYNLDKDSIMSEYINSNKYTITEY